MPRPEIAPFMASAPGCGAGVRVFEGRWSRCAGEVVVAGPKTFRHKPREVWLAFACAAHADWLDEPRPLTAGDVAALEHRRAQHRRALAGLPHERARPVSRSSRPGTHERGPRERRP